MGRSGMAPGRSGSTSDAGQQLTASSNPFGDACSKLAAAWYARAVAQHQLAVALVERDDAFDPGQLDGGAPVAARKAATELGEQAAHGLAHERLAGRRMQHYVVVGRLDPADLIDRDDARCAAFGNQ